jgi:lipopolysaccharide transport system permease protein
MTAVVVAGRRRAGRTLVLARVLAVREVRARYRQSKLEMFWSILTPIVMVGVYGFVLTRVFQVDGGGLPYLSLVWSGMVIWTVFSSAVGAGVGSIVANRDLLSKVYFPREALPLATTGAALYDLVISGGLLALLVAVQIRSVSVTAVAAVVPLTVIIVWSAALSVMLGALAVFVRDVLHLTRLALQVGFFATPVMYSSDYLPPGLSVLNSLNPVAACIDGLRDAIILQQWPDMGLLAVHGAVGMMLLLAAVAYTSAVEDRMVDAL